MSNLIAHIFRDDEYVTNNSECIFNEVVKLEVEDGDGDRGGAVQ